MRAAGQKEYVNLAKGLVTEVSPLSFPDGATADELNFTVNKDGLIRKRREGFEYIYPQTTFAGADSVLENIFYWRGSGYIITVLTNSIPETYLRVHAVDATLTTVTDIKIADALVSTQIAELTNYLVLTLSNNAKPILLEYDAVAETIEVSGVGLYVRDFELVDDGLSAAERPTTLTDNHHYNLLNAGWYIDKKDEDTAGFPLDNTKDVFFAAFAEYPSNADSVGVGMITNGSGEFTFDPEYVRDAGLGNSLSPRGHYVFPIDEFNRTTTLATPTVDGSPSNTLTLLGTASLTGIPSYDPEDPTAPTLPFEPYPDEPIYDKGWYIP